MLGDDGPEIVRMTADAIDLVVDLSAGDPFMLQLYEFRMPLLERFMAGTWPHIRES